MTGASLRLGPVMRLPTRLHAPAIQLPKLRIIYQIKHGWLINWEYLELFAMGSQAGEVALSISAIEVK